MATIEAYLDSLTVLLFALSVKVLLAFLFFVFWARTPRAIWFAWWGVTFVLGSAAAANVILNGFRAEFLSLGLTGAILIACFGCCWQGARAFEHRSPLWLPLAIPPLLWLAASLTPAFDREAFRLISSSLLMGSMLALSAFEFWRGRGERLASRWMAIGLLISLSLVFFIRIPLVDVAPFPFGIQPFQRASMSLFNMLMFFHTVILAVLLVAMTKERSELEQRNASYVDPLTNTSNRRGFMAMGSRLLARHEYDKHELCALFLDIDGFKLLNDRLGHARGDRVLKRFVAIVQENIRPTDFLFRIGGDEFCCLLPQTITEQGYWVAERIRRQVEAELGGSDEKMTVSIGIASTTVSGYDLDALLRESDSAVYAAKRRGRNRVVTAEAKEHASARPITGQALTS
ncbi:MAG TPA: GGDEF domain-containing protein [Xanthobacteraceae bacterium]|nr:GGDEF domain-containing protein [Xanthobacteraceae bacterium]